MSIDKKAFGISDSLIQAVNEALKGNQHKIDVAEPKGKITGADFKKLRGESAKPDFLDIDKDGNKKEPMKQAAKQAKEEVEQVDEISLKTKINAYKAASSPDADYNYGSKVHAQADRLRSKIAAKHGEKAGTHADRAAHGKPSTPATRSAEKAKSDPLTKATSSTNKMRITKSGVANKQDQKSNAAIIKSRLGKHGKSNLPEEVEVTEAEDAVAKQIAAKKDQFKKQLQQKIAAKQMNTMQAKANKRLSNIHASNDKCTCQESKGKSMSCEVCNGGKSMKGGKEKIEVNPPMREAAELPKKVITKGHEIAKSIIKHKGKVDNPYAVGMAAAKKSAGIKEDAEQVDEVLDSPIKKMAYVMKAKKSIEKSDPKKIKQANDIANRVIGIKRVMNKVNKKD